MTKKDFCASKVSCSYTDKFSLIFEAITLPRAKGSMKKNFKTVYICSWAPAISE